MNRSIFHKIGHIDADHALLHIAHVLAGAIDIEEPQDAVVQPDMASEYPNGNLGGELIASVEGRRL